MRGIVLLINIATVALCSPSRYPFVFLLDIGNEEIQETTKEQIRVSMGGGSATLRYPALGDGELITHVRVTAVDFGANLMATVVDGGPGYKYAVVVVAGNKDSPYEVLLTFDTLKNTKNSNFYEQTLRVSEKDADVNDSSEDISDMNSETQKTRTNQNFDSNNVFVENNPKDVSEDNVFNDEDSVSINESGGSTTGDENNTKYGKEQENPIDLSEYQQYYRDDQLSYASHSPPDGDSIDRNDPDEYNLIDTSRHEDEVPNAEPYNFVQNKDQTDEEQSAGVVDQNLYDKYKALRPHVEEDVQAYSYTPGDVDVNRQMSVEESPEEIDQMFNDEEIHSTIPKSQDSNNNNYIIDTDETSAVAY